MQTIQSEILSGLDQGFVDQLLAVGDQRSFEKGAIMFLQGEPALNFYLLIRGRVRLSMGHDRNAVYTVTRIGEAIGWSALTGRTSYSATAICMAPSMLMMFHRQDLVRLLDEDRGNAGMFYKNLAHVLGNGLINARARLAERICVDDKTEFSIDQVQSSLDFV